MQRQVLYLGEINDCQASSWRKTISVFDEHKQQFEQLSLFPSDRPIPADEVNALSVILSELRLSHPRSFGDCWLGCLLWEELNVAQHVFGPRLSLAATPMLARFYEEFPARPTCEAVLGQQPCPITARPEEAAVVAKIQQLIA